MIHLILFPLGLFLIMLGAVICTVLISVSVKGPKKLWLITVPGVVIVALLTSDFVRHMLHLPHQLFPHEKQVLKAIRWMLDALMVPVVVMNLYGRLKKRGEKKVELQPPS